MPDQVELGKMRFTRELVLTSGPGDPDEHKVKRLAQVDCLPPPGSTTQLDGSINRVRDRGRGAIDGIGVVGTVGVSATQPVVSAAAGFTAQSRVVRQPAAAAGRSIA